MRRNRANTLSNGRSIEFAAPIQHQQEGNHRTRWPHNFRRIFLAEKCEDELFEVRIGKEGRTQGLLHARVSAVHFEECRTTALGLR